MTFPTPLNGNKISPFFKAVTFPFCDKEKLPKYLVTKGKESYFNPIPTNFFYPFLIKTNVIYIFLTVLQHVNDKIHKCKIEQM